MKSHLLIFFAIILISCKNDSSKQVEITTSNNSIQADSINENLNTEFSTYLDSLNSIHLPIQFGCNVEYLHEKMKNFAYNPKFAPPGGSTPTRIIHNEQRNLIIHHFSADIYFPILYSYDDNGKMIDSLLLINGSCNGDPYYNSSCRTTIDENIKITRCDTVHEYNIVNDQRILSGIELIKDVHTIDSNGSFKLIQKEVKPLTHH